MDYTNSTAAPSANNTPMLARQWSFEEANPAGLGEAGALSSSQAVKQRLKECVLSRRLRLAQPASQSSSIDSDCSSPGSHSYNTAAAEHVLRSYPLPTRIPGTGSRPSYLSARPMDHLHPATHHPPNHILNMNNNSSTASSSLDTGDQDPQARLRKTASEPNLFKARSSVKRRVTLHNSRMSGNRHPCTGRSMDAPSGHMEDSALSPTSALGPQLPTPPIVSSPPQLVVVAPDGGMMTSQTSPLHVITSTMHQSDPQGNMCYTMSLPSLNSSQTMLGGSLKSLVPSLHPLLCPGGILPLLSPLDQQRASLSLQEHHNQTQEQRLQKRRKMRLMRRVVSDESPPPFTDDCCHIDPCSTEDSAWQHHLSIPSYPGHRCTPLLIRQASIGGPGCSPTGQQHLLDPMSALGRTHSTPMVNLPSPIQEEGFGSRTSQMDLHDQDDTPDPTKTGLSYDPDLLTHRCTCQYGDDPSVHPECPSRLRAIWSRLTEARIVDRCKLLRAKRASQDDLQLCHTEEYSVVHGTNSEMRSRLNPLLVFSTTRFCELQCGGTGLDSDTVWNDRTTPHTARLATGHVINSAQRVARGLLRNAFALVRPPGHHAESSQALGFCYFNSVAIAAKSLLASGQASRILLLDWDVHHGNGSQAAFLNDPSVLYISLHRYDNGAFFPGTGDPAEVGKGRGEGRCVNIAWETPTLQQQDAPSSPSTMSPSPSSSTVGLGDAEYLAAFRHLVLPIATEFSPDFVLVSAGFDAAPGHSDSLGGYSVSPAAFAWMTRQLMNLANGKVTMALEGGYNVSSLCDCIEACMRALLAPSDAGASSLPSMESDDVSWRVSDSELTRPPCLSAVHSMARVVGYHAPFWRCLRHLDDAILSQSFVARLSHHQQVLLHGSGHSSQLSNQFASLRMDAM